MNLKKRDYKRVSPGNDLGIVVTPFVCIKWTMTKTYSARNVFF